MPLEGVKFISYKIYVNSACYHSELIKDIKKLVWKVWKGSLILPETIFISSERLYFSCVLCFAPGNVLETFFIKESRTEIDCV